jgi:hypothetical protein
MVALVISVSPAVRVAIANARRMVLLRSLLGWGLFVVLQATVGIE